MLPHLQSPPLPWVAGCAQQVQRCVASTNKSLAPMNKSPDVGRATKDRSALQRCRRIGLNSSFSPRSANLPWPANGRGLFPFHDFDEQIFGADEQSGYLTGAIGCPKTTSVVQKMHSRRANSVRASKKSSALPVTQSGQGRTDQSVPLCLTCPG